MAGNDSQIARRKRVLFILRDARFVIARPYGWIKHANKRRTKRTDNGFAYCATGALRAVSRNYNTSKCAERVLQRALAEIEGPSKLDSFYAILPSIEAFNDEPSTRKADVLAAFDRAIEIAKKEGL